MSNQHTYVNKIKAQLDDLSKSMDEMEKSASEVKNDARKFSKIEMDKLRAQSKLALAKLDELKIAGEDSWKNMVEEVEKVRDAFTHSFNYFKSQLQKPTSK